MKYNLLAAAVALAFATAVSAQTPSRAPDANPKADTTTRADRAPAGDRSMDRKVKNAEEEKIEAEYKADKARCDGLKGNAHEVCEKEAKGKERIAKAELEAKKDPSERNQRKVKEARAEADYEVAKEKCDDMKGKEKSACEKEAKAMRDRAKADIKGDKSASRGATAPERRQ
jgi:hypothetical protein